MVSERQEYCTVYRPVFEMLHRARCAVSAKHIVFGGIANPLPCGRYSIILDTPSMVCLAVLALGLSAGSFALAMGSDVSLSARTDTLSHIAAAIAESDGIQVEVEEPLRDCVICCRIRNRDANEVLKTLARVTYSRLEAIPGGAKLAPDSDARSAAETRAVAFRSELLKPLLETLANQEVEADSMAKATIASLRKLREDNDSGADLKNGVRAPRVTGPADFLLAFFLRELGPKTLASLPAYQPVAYCDAPGVLERTLPNLPSGYVKACRDAEEQITTLITPDLLEEPATADWASQALERAKSFTDISRIVLLVGRYGPAVWSTIGLYNPSGKLVGSASATFEMAPKVADGIRTAPMGLRPISAELHSLFPGKVTGQPYVLSSNETVSPSAMEALRHPEAFDPLGFAVADGIGAVASDRDWIACLPDSSFDAAAALAARHGLPRSVPATIRRQGSAEGRSRRYLGSNA